MNNDKAAKIEEIARRRGFFWIGSEIYNGLSGFYDYGHLGASMKRKWENTWRDYFLNLEDYFVEIEPAETIVEGVVYYRVKVLFENINEKIKSGMSADVTIETNKKENVLYIPQRAVSSKDSKKFVKIPDNKGVKELEVITGLKGSNGEIEIIFGLNEGDKVISFIKK